MTEALPAPGDDDGSIHDVALVERQDSSSVQRISSYKTASKPATEEPLASGLSNEDLWMLIRRFNKHIYHVRTVPDSPPQALDLNRAADEQFPPEKLRTTIERFYVSVVVGVVNFFKHIARLRSWKDSRRTSIFCAAYFAAWFFDVLIPAIVGFLVVLIWFPRIRPLLFPPAPRAEVGAAVNVSPPSAGESVSHDGITGAPERHKGEAAEQEASQLVNSLASVAIEGAAGKYGQSVPEDTTEGPPPGPDPPQVVAAITDGQTEGPPPDSKTKEPMKKKVGKATDEAMRIAGDIADVYEKLANALSPTPPFRGVAARLRLVGVLAPISLVSLVPNYWIVKGSAFAIGLGFFGDPVVQRGMESFKHCIPDWKIYLRVQEFLLKGIPTNAQLTLTLLRMGEVESSPLPPPPGSQENEPMWPVYNKKLKNMTRKNDDDDEDAPADTQRQQSKDTPPAKSKRRFLAKMFKFVGRTISTAIKGHTTFDRAMTIAGTAQTKGLFAMLHSGTITMPTGPLKFDGKFERKRGAVVIDSSKEPPVLYFTTYQSARLEDLRLESRKKDSVLFQLPVTEIQELKKTEGLGWKGKLIVELTAGSKESADGLVIWGPEPGQGYHVTGMRERDQLFNRLVAVGVQFWESR